MFGLICLLIAFLSLGLLGGAIAIIIDKRKKENVLQQALGELRQGKMESDRIISEKDSIILEAESQADAIVKEAKKESDRIIASADSIIQEAQKESDRLTDRQLELTEHNQKLEAKRKDLQKTVKALEEQLAYWDVNLYEPHFQWEKAEDYERALNKNRELQKEFIKSANAISGVNSKDKTAKAISNMLLRSFNSECDLYISNVTYKNVVTYENRITQSFLRLNKLAEDRHIAITTEYCDLKIEELRIVHEYEERKHEIEEEQKRFKEIMRDEIRAERELEKAKENAAREIEKYQILLDRAMEAAKGLIGKELQAKEAQIKVLQDQVAEAKANERSISLAQQTKAGHVYIISNIGSLGENIYKIGMTRRLDPQERIDELGDASVPFPFDIHALIQCQNAPELENILHTHFANNRVNKVNHRKEFFNVSLDEIKKVVLKHNAEVTFSMLAEAKEYRQSKAMAQKGVES